MRTFAEGNRATPEVRQLARDIFRASRRADPFIQLETQDREPDRPQAGMVVLADGTNWNPGSGAGYYGYYGGAWVKLG